MTGDFRDDIHEVVKFNEGGGSYESASLDAIGRTGKGCQYHTIHRPGQSKIRSRLKSYEDLYQWSVDDIPDFWAAFWEFAGIKASKKWEKVVDDLTKFPGARWFVGAKLNFAENLLRYRDDRIAFIFRGETQKSAKMTYRELYATVARLAKSLREIGVGPGDRVAGYMPNLMETAIAMLATTSIGAVWSSCATDIGPLAALDRLGQIEPKVLFSVNGYFYKGKAFNSLANAAEVAKAIPSLKKAGHRLLCGR